MPGCEPTFGSLFAGIGGIDLGLERAGWRGLWQVERDPYCRHVLAHRWPELPCYGEIADIDWGGIERPALLAGGFPCQPVSAAGRQRGAADDRWLWPEFARAIGALRPRFVLVENVRNLLAVGSGSVFGGVLGDLAALGYDAEWDCIPAAAIGAPHRRDRVWIVAYLADAQELPERPRLRAGGAAPERGRRSGDGGRQEALADSQRAGPQGHAGDGADGPGRAEPDRSAGSGGLRPGWDPERWWAAEPDVGRVAHGVPARVDRLRALGNAVVPGVAEMIGQRILESDRW